MSDKQSEKLRKQRYHKRRHRLLHRHLDELVADMIGHTRALPSKTSVRDLMEWSYAQTKDPTEYPEES